MSSKIQFKEPRPGSWSSFPDDDRGIAGWSGKFDPPNVGTRVLIIMNGWKIGGESHERGDIPGTVLGYRIDAGWMMVVVESDFLPHWIRKEDPSRVAVFAGCELELIP